MQDRRMLALTVCATVAAFIAAMMANMTIAQAQDVATPAATESTGSDLPHLAHVNAGSCDALAHIVYKLEDVGTGGDSATPEPAVEPAAEASPSIVEAVAETVKQSTTVINVSLDDLLADDYAINIHESIEAVDTYVACGDITGTASDGSLVIELNEQNDSGISGSATLTDNGDGTTTVAIALAEGVPGSTGTPEATPVS